MIVEVDENYGADIDGNRGIRVYNYEVEPSDTNEIVEQLYEDFLDGIVGKTCIALICPMTEEGVLVDVDIDDYITELKQLKRDSGD